jgi:DNA modification methylase
MDLTDKIYQGDACRLMADIPDDYLPLTVTSPPYGHLRTYGGYDFDFEALARHLYRTTRPGGVVVWVTGDTVVNGSETGLSFRQALHFMDLGFLLHDTMIY